MNEVGLRQFVAITTGAMLLHFSLVHSTCVTRVTQSGVALITGSAYRKSRVSSVWGCIEICEGDSQCAAVNLDLLRMECFLVNDREYSLVPRDNSLSYVKMPPAMVCNFDTNIESGCGFRNVGPYPWLRHRLGTPSSNTGPTGDHTTGGGHYMYSEASHGTLGIRWILESKLYTANGDRCLRFYYHMYGSTMGSLMVKYRLQGSSQDVQIWKKSGNQGRQWFRASLVINNPAASYTIRFVASRGSDYMSDSSIDDVTIIDNCNSL